MYKKLYISIILFFLGMNIFSIELNISWNRRVYNDMFNLMIYEYQAVEEIEFHSTVVVLVDPEPFREINTFIFRVYYNDATLLLQKTISPFHSRNRAGYIAIEFRAIASIEHLEQMQEDDILFYRSSFEFPSGEIFKSNPIRVTFTQRHSTHAFFYEGNMEFPNFSYLLVSDDGEFHQIRNFREDGFVVPYNQRNNSPDRITVSILFQDIIPGKRYSLHFLNENGFIQSTIMQQIPFHILAFFF